MLLLFLLMMIVVMMIMTVFFYHDMALLILRRITLMKSVEVQGWNVIIIGHYLPFAHRPGVYRHPYTSSVPPSPQLE